MARTSSNANSAYVDAVNASNADSNAESTALSADTATNPVFESAPNANVEPELGLDEYCTQLSTNDRRIELIGAFHVSENAAGRVKATRAEFDAHFLAFGNQPA